MNFPTTARAAVLALATAAAVTGCGGPGPAAASLTPDQRGRPVEVTDSKGLRPGFIPGGPPDPPSDADRPDGPSPTPDGELTASDLKGLIRVPASARSTADSCSPHDVRLSLSGIEAAAGHRYAQLIATNTSDRTCQLVGWPGLGLRGAWGTAFPILAERSTMQVDRIGVPTADPATGATLASGDRAAAEFEWTGALAGTRDEPVSLIAVQFAADGIPVAFRVDPADHVDVGPQTTVRVGPWGPAR